MADNTPVALTDSDNEVQTQRTPERTTVSSVSPTRGIPQHYVTGEARVIRTHRGRTGSPRADPYAVYTGNPSIRMFPHSYARRWDWMPTTLNAWRTEEEIRLPADPMEISPYTQEPMHHTVPVLAARLYRHESRLEDLDQEQRMITSYVVAQLYERISHQQRQLDDLHGIVDLVHEQMTADRGAEEIYRNRLEELEQRSQDAEEYARVLAQRLTVTEDGVRQTGRLAETVDRLVSLMTRLNLRRD